MTNASSLKHIQTLRYDSPSRGLNEVTVHHDIIDDEYFVRVYWNGKQWMNGDYWTDSKQDALDYAARALAKPGAAERKT